MKNFKKLVYCALLFLHFSCTKDDLTMPAQVNLQMTMETDEAGLRIQKQEEYIKIEKARYRFSAIEFEGYRQTGNDYFFTKEFEEGLEVRVKKEREAEILDFDMPQGVYDQVKISLLVRKSAGDRKGKPGKGVLYNEDAAIIMEGFYTNPHQEQTPLIFVYNFDETFEHAAQPAGGSVIAVEKSKKNKATIQFDAAYWMQLINSRMLQSAKLSEIEGVPTIIISENHNEHIFTVLSSRIKDASDLTFN